MTDEFEFDADDSFEPLEAKQVVRDYACGVCYGQLTQLYQAGDRRVLVVCPEHGNITRVGRVMWSTVDIRMAQAKFYFPHAVRALSDLWGELIPAKKSAAQNLKELGF